MSVILKRDQKVVPSTSSGDLCEQRPPKEEEVVARIESMPECAYSKGRTEEGEINKPQTEFSE